MLKVELLLICGVKAAFRILIIGCIRVPCRKNHIYRVTHFRENYVENLQNAMSYFRTYSNLNDAIFWSCFGGFYATKKRTKKIQNKKETERKEPRCLDKRCLDIKLHICHISISYEFPLLWYTVCQFFASTYLIISALSVLLGRFIFFIF